MPSFNAFNFCSSLKLLSVAFFPNFHQFQHDIASLWSAQVQQYYLGSRSNYTLFANLAIGCCPMDVSFPLLLDISLFFGVSIVTEQDTPLERAALFPRVDLLLRIPLEQPVNKSAKFALHTMEALLNNGLEICCRILTRAILYLRH